MKIIPEMPITAYPILITIIWAILTLPFIGIVPLFDYDETIYAQTALDMMRQSEWTVPTANGMQFFEKPPFTYYMMDACYALFGVNAFSARLPSAIFTLLTALLLYRFGKSTKSPQFGLITALVFLSMLEVGLLAHAAILDAVLNFFIAACFLFYFRWLQTDSLKHALWCALLMGAAVSIKGPVGAVVPVLVIIADRLLAGDFTQTLKRIPWLAALSVFIVASTPWYVMIFMKHGSDFLYEFIWVHNIGRALNPMQGHGGGWHYYIIVFAVSILPWLAWLPRILSKHTSQQHSGLFRLCWLWTAVVIVLFTFAQTKLPHYISCVFPAVALLIAMALEQNHEELRSLKKIRWSTIGILLPVSLILIGFPWLYEWIPPLIHHPRALAIINQPLSPSLSISISGLILLACLLWLLKRHTYSAVQFIVLGFVLQLCLLIPLGGFAGKLVQGPQSAIAEVIRTLPEHMPVYSYNLNYPSISFQSGRNYQIILNHEGSQTIYSSKPPYAVIMRSESLEELSWLKPYKAEINQGGFLLYMIRQPVSGAAP
ncbi:MAG: hypothetical protein CO186_03490 [Zetaproteobacteria bacterium CG_4_9_14_3_um_filter_49_83]|nr:MAG: hypothetical protein AUJ56_07895 [Zetaproteobacteria bacterium CG1_02_49_23]PIQ32632.1 MAG: hypothetical protein COW62_07150 [Zetaproteobacteria bacterium CG17_big_fil_post_rev_8_21_14_2_50_50_13]PIV29642.1 MAG: hypothetical protein COS35_10890 [Zetaproteobacteria bacterium CG02_land_8_20_14_3_00_50_9]PIY54696.1 MAG: hypothetical protein COZ00_13320 [Zetaproteobacteria bacterium CG_4_10_14_0_8_um_filter_49_80]PJA35887.1 MAG: hypothetical protein CO186_03490 [Zetaproteobacteria bacterium